MALVRANPRDSSRGFRLPNEGRSGRGPTFAGLSRLGKYRPAGRARGGRDEDDTEGIEGRRSEALAGARPSPRSGHRVPCRRGRCRPVRIQSGGHRFAGWDAGALLLSHADRTRCRDPAGEPQLRQRSGSALHPGKTRMQRRVHRDQQKRRNNPADNSERRGAHGLAHPGIPAEGDRQRQDGRLGKGRRLLGTPVLHRLRTVPDPFAGGDGPRGRDLRRLLLTRHRALVGRPPRLLRADAGRFRGEQPGACQRRSARGSRLGMRLEPRCEMDRPGHARSR